jgi:hypothetical protein
MLSHTGTWILLSDNTQQNPNHPTSWCPSPGLATRPVSTDMVSLLLTLLIMIKKPTPKQTPEPGMELSSMRRKKDNSTTRENANKKKKVENSLIKESFSNLRF